MIKFRSFGFSRSAEPVRDLPTETAPAALPTPTTTEHNPNGKKILIVDDDRFYLRATQTKLRAAGFSVRTACDGSEAIAALGDNPADVILLDINFQPDVCHGGLGSWDGFQIMTWLRGNPSARGARFIMVSSSDTLAERERARKLGAVAYLQKPVDPAQLISLVNAEN